jgi:endoglucanase
MQLAGAGARVGALSIPTRYIHSPSEVCDLDDVRACASLAAEFIKNSDL